MADVLATRKMLGVIGPSTNTIVQPEFDDMRPAGVTNHYSRIFTDNAKAISNETFMTGVYAIGENVKDAVKSVMTCAPDYLVMGMSAVTFFGGRDGADQFRADIEETAGVGVSTGALSCVEALKAYGGVKRIAFVSPYFPVMNEQVSRFFGDHGFETVRERSLQCPSWTAIAQVTTQTLRDVLCNDLNGDDVDAIIQVGTNLCMARFAGEAERWLGKPVIAINTATYWDGLRRNGIDDKISGFGRLLSEF